MVTLDRVRSLGSEEVIVVGSPLGNLNTPVTPILQYHLVLRVNATSIHSMAGGGLGRSSEHSIGKSTWLFILSATWAPCKLVL